MRLPVLSRRLTGDTKPHSRAPRDVENRFQRTCMILIARSPMTFPQAVPVLCDLVQPLAGEAMAAKPIVAGSFRKPPAIPERIL